MGLGKWMQWVQLNNDLNDKNLFAAFHFEYDEMELGVGLCILLDSFDVHPFLWWREKKKNSITNMYVISFLFQTFWFRLYLKGIFCQFYLLKNFLMTKFLFRRVFKCCWCLLIKSSSILSIHFFASGFSWYINKSCFF